MMDWEKLKKDLAWEAKAYLADLQAMREELRRVEGWIALLLFALSVAIFLAWFFVSMGFSPPIDHVTAILYSVGLRPCRPVDNVSGVFIIIDILAMGFLTVLMLGNVINMIGRVKQGLPREPGELIVTTSLVLIVGIGGIVYMLMVC